MPTAKRQDWIPTGNDNFYNKQRAYFDRIVANKVAWGIPDGAIAPLLALQAEYEPLYWKIQDKRARTGGDVTAHNDCRERYEKAWRTFHKERVAGNSLIPKSELSILVGKERDTEPTPRPEITTAPIVGLKGLEGGRIEVRCRVRTDQTRPSMHTAANEVAVNYILVERGDIAPENPEKCPEKVVISKAKFIIDAGPENAGKQFYGFFRWANTSRPERSGPWSKAHAVIVP